MKKLMLPMVAFLVFFALGTGGGAYATRPVASDSTHADSTHGDSTKHDTTKADTSHGSAATVTPNHPEADSVKPAAIDTAHAPKPSPTAAATPETPRRPGNPTTIESLVRAQSGATVTMRPDGTIGPERPDSQPNYQRMASLLSKMGAREAARTIEQLNSTEAARALAAMNDKQAAAVLAQLAPDKAAALLQATLAMIPRTAAP